MTSNRVHGTVGADPARQWQGIYLGRVTHNRHHDLWIRAQVPQVMGEAETNWMAPALDPRQGRSYLDWAFERPCSCDVPDCDPPQPSGPGPRPGVMVLVMFIGGDVNTPVYLLYGLDWTRQQSHLLTPVSAPVN